MTLRLVSLFRCLEAKPIYLTTDYRPNQHRLNVEEKKMKVTDNNIRQGSL